MTYTFKITYGTVVNSQVYPIYGDNFDKVYTKSTEYAGSRVKLNSNLTFKGVDYDAIVGADYGTIFYITIDKGIYTNYYKGKFTINDCDVDQDMSYLTVELTTNDDYLKLDEIYTTEVLINELELPKIKVNYKRDMLIQTYVTNNIEGDSYVMNHQGGSFWKQSCTPLTAKNISQEYSDDWAYTVRKARSFCYTDTPYLEFNGVWEATKIYNTGIATQFTHESGNFRIDRKMEFNTFSRPYWWTLTDLRTNIVTWRSEDIDEDQGYDINDITKYTFVQVGDTNVFSFAEERIIYQRALGVAGAFKGVFDEYQNPQVFCTNEQYTVMANVGDIFNDLKIYASKRVQLTPTVYNVNPDYKYFKKLESTTDYDNTVLALNYWGWFSLWIQSSYDVIEWQKQFSLETYTYGYKLGDIIDGILEKYNINKQFISSFFSESTNPISSDTKTTPILTEISNMGGVDPKNNILAINGEISISTIMTYLESFGLRWDLTDNHFRVEHKYFYENGETYGTAPGVGIDLTDKTNTRNSKNWAFGKNQYTVDDSDEKKYIEYEVDECSDFFKTSNIELDINNEETDKVSFDGFISDIGYINAMSSDIKDSGSFVLMLIDSDNNTLYKSFSAKNTTINAQNLQASLPYTSNKYLRYNYSTLEVDIDDNTITVLGYFRPIIQEVTYPLTTTELDPNMNKLVKTALGNGFLIENTVNLPYNYCKMKLRHEY